MFITRIFFYYFTTQFGDVIGLFSTSEISHVAVRKIHKCNQYFLESLSNHKKTIFYRMRKEG